MTTPLMMKTIIIAFSCSSLILASFFLVKWVSAIALNASSFLLEFLQFHKKFLLNFIPVMNPAEQHIKITLKQSSTNQLIQRDKSSLI
jgi:hypothetical protein